MSSTRSDDSSDFMSQSPQYEFPSCNKLIPVNQASIFMIYHGLMCLAYNNECGGVLEAGMHSKAPCHRFKLHVFRFRGNLGNPEELYSFQPDSHKDVPGRLITVDISRPQDPGVCFYSGTEPVLNWTQCLDLEGCEFYDRRMRKNNVLKPKITVNHGVFYCIPTPHEYLRFEEIGYSGTNIGTIGYLALGMVRHAGTGSISIITKREKLTLPCSRTNPLAVLISNACNETRCPADQNDFPEYYRVVKLRSHERRFRLQRRRARTSLNLGSLSSFSNLLLREPFASILSSLDAPCGFSVLGRSRGIDDNEGT